MLRFPTTVDILLQLMASRLHRTVRALEASGERRRKCTAHSNLMEEEWMTKLVQQLLLLPLTLCSGPLQRLPQLLELLRQLRSPPRLHSRCLHCNQHWRR